MVSFSCVCDTIFVCPTCVSVQVTLLHAISIGRGQREDEEDSFLLFAKQNFGSGEPGGTSAPFSRPEEEEDKEEGDGDTQRTRQSHHEPPAGPSAFVVEEPLLLRQAQGVQLQEHEPAPEGLRGQQKNERRVSVMLN